MFNKSLMRNYGPRVQSALLTIILRRTKDTSLRNALRELDNVIERVRKEPNNHVMVAYLERVRSEMVARVFRKPNSECECIGRIANGIDDFLHYDGDDARGGAIAVYGQAA